MIVSILLIMLACCHAWILLELLRMGTVTARRLILIAMASGMLIANLVVAAGPWGVGNEWYQWPAYLRFTAHVFVLPFLLVFGLLTMQAIGVRWARSPLMFAACWAFVLAAVLISGIEEMLTLELAPRYYLDHVRLIDATSSLPWPTIIVNVVLIILGAIVWRRRGWPWMFLGSLFIFIMNGSMGHLDFGFLTGAVAETTFLYSLFRTEQFLPAKAQTFF